MKAYGIVGDARSQLMPELPTLAEQGLPNVAMEVWSGLYAPKATSAAIIERLSAALEATLNDPDFRNAIVAVGQEIPPRELTTPAGAATFLRTEIDKWRPLVEAWAPAR